MFALRNWDHSLDDKIIKVIERDGKTTFYYLWEEIFGEKVSRDTLNDHLKIMEEQEIIKKDPLETFEIGKKRYIRLTHKTKRERKRGIFEGVKSKGEANSLIRDKRILIMFILSNAMLGFHFKRSSHRRPGDVPSLKGPVGYSMRTLGGTTAGDLMRLKDTTLSYNKKFAYLKISKHRIEQIIKSLRNDFPAILRPIQADGKIRLKIEDESLERFVIFCDNMLREIVTWLEFRWILKKTRSRIRKQKETQWYGKIFGPVMIREFFVKINERRMRDDNFNRGYLNENNLGKTQVDYIVKRINENELKRKEETIQSYVNWIEKFSKIKENYPEFYSLIMEIVYPDFLKETDILIEK